MSYIDSTRKSYSSPYEITVCMTKEECKILLPFFQKAYKSVKSKYEKYNDIHNGGEATEREENLLMKYSEQLERLESVLSSIDEILKSYLFQIYSDHRRGDVPGQQVPYPPCRAVGHPRYLVRIQAGFREQPDKHISGVRGLHVPEIAQYPFLRHFRFTLGQAEQSEENFAFAHKLPIFIITFVHPHK